MFDLSIALYFAWAGVVSLFFSLFWTYLPFALAAQELAEVTKRYK
jgi:hypothetical protein